MMETTNYASNSGSGSTLGEPCEMMEVTNYASNNGGSSTSGGHSGPGGNKSNDRKRQRFGKRKSEEEEDDDRDYGDSDSDNDGGGDGGDGGHRRSDIEGRKVIKVSSGASVECEDHFQKFTICVHFHANIRNDDNSDRMLFIDADIIACRAGALLSQNWKQLSNLGRGYFLESVAISFFPITDATNNRSALYELEYYSPKVKNRTVESLVGIEKQGSLDIGTSSKFGFLMKNSESTKTIPDEWRLRTWGCETTGDHWMYEYEKRPPDQVQFEPGHHISKWLIGEQMSGFGVKITQVLCFNFTTVGAVNKLVDFKPKLVMCPKVSHTLEINFNGLKDFNEKFMSLEHFRRGRKHVTEVSANIVRPNRDIISLYEIARDAEKGAIEANREETLRWCFYAREFKSMYKDFMVSNKVGEKKAKVQIISPKNPDNPEDEEQDDDQNNVLEVQVNLLDLAKASAPIPLTHVSNSSGKSQIEEGGIYYDEGVIMKMMARMMKDVIGYYYRNERYEKKVLPMTSPIISPIYA